MYDHIALEYETDAYADLEDFPKLCTLLSIFSEDGGQRRYVFFSIRSESGRAFQNKVYPYFLASLGRDPFFFLGYHKVVYFITFLRIIDCRRFRSKAVVRRDVFFHERLRIHHAMFLCTCSRDIR